MSISAKKLLSIGLKATSAVAAVAIIVALIHNAQAQTGTTTPSGLPDPFAPTAPATQPAPAKTGSNTNGTTAPAAPAASPATSPSAPATNPTTPSTTTPTTTPPSSAAPSSTAAPKASAPATPAPGLIPATKPSAGSNPFGDDNQQPGPGNLAPIPRTPDSSSTIPPIVPPAVPSDTSNPLKAPPGNLPNDLKSSEADTTPGQSDFEQGKTLADAGKYNEAIEAYKRAIKATKGADPSQYVQLGVAYRMLDRYNEAIDAFSHAIDLDPSVAYPYFRRGICWFHKGEYGQALLDFDEAAGLDQTDPRASTWKGMTLVRQGRLLDAVNIYSMAILNDNRFVLAHVNRGLAYAALQDYRKAIVDFDAALNVTPNDATLYVKRATVQSMSGDLQGAVNSDSEAIRLDPKNAEAYRNRADAYRQLGDTAHATADSQRAQELSLANDHKTASTE